MRLSDLDKLEGLTLRSGPTDAVLTDITDDSRRVKPGMLFIARGSNPETVRFIEDAVKHGASAVVSESFKTLNLPGAVAHYQADPVDQALAGLIAERFFGEPAGKLTLIGVTGTNGKTTITFLIQHLLKQLGIQTGLIGTIYNDDGSPDGRHVAKLTTPGAVDLSRELARMVNAGCKTVAIETSSHALEQKRVAALRFRAGVFTNLTQDHLDYHQTMPAYAEAKSILFQQLTGDGLAVVNRDDPYAEQVLADYTGRVRFTSLSPSTLGEGEQSCLADEIELRADSSRARLVGPWGDRRVTIPLVGRHNVANVLQALAVAYDFTQDMDTLFEAIATLPQVPGRLQRVKLPATDNTNPLPIPNVLVDYCHTPDALDNALSSLKPLTTGRLIVVFGCGGDRDKTKRPIMARAACRYADRIYLTSDNPRTEDPDAIIHDAIAGVPEDRNADLVVQADRAQAIRAAIMEAAPADTVLLAGKGHEDYQTLGRENIHFDDREHAQQALIHWAKQEARR